MMTKPVKPYLNKKEIMTVLKKADQKFTFNRNRDTFIFKLLAFSGIEVSELIKINVGDISIDGESMSLVVKSSSSRAKRTIFLPYALLKDDYGRYIEEYSPKSTLFYSNTEPTKPICRNLITTIVKEVLSRGKTKLPEKDRTCQMLRRSFALTLNNEKSKVTGLTMPESAIKSILGIKNLSNLRELLGADRDEVFNSSDYF